MLQLIRPSDMCNPEVDECSMMTYLFQFRSCRPGIMPDHLNCIISMKHFILVYSLIFSFTIMMIRLFQVSYTSTEIVIVSIYYIAHQMIRSDHLKQITETRFVFA